MSTIDDIKKEKRNAELKIEKMVLLSIENFESNYGAAINDLKLELIRHKTVGKLHAKMFAVRCKIIVEI